jgi:hypothetical protein
MSEDKPQSLMEYVEALEELERKCTNVEVRRELKFLLSNLSTLMLSQSLNYNRQQPLQERLTKEVVNNEDFADFNFVTYIEQYFGLIFDFIAHSTRETQLLSQCIINLVEKMNEMQSDLEAYQLKLTADTMAKEEPERQEREKEIKKVEPPKDLFPTQVDDEEAEIMEGVQRLRNLRKMEQEKPEEEEEEEWFAKFAYSCTKCNNTVTKTEVNGCPHCGNETWQVKYL